MSTIRPARRKVSVVYPLPTRIAEAFRRLKTDARRESRRRARETEPPPAPPAPAPLDLVPKPVPAKVRRRRGTALSPAVPYDLAGLALAVGQDPDHFRANPWPAWRPRHLKKLHK